jgi:hypothetical protein
MRPSARAGRRSDIWEVPAQLSRPREAGDACGGLRTGAVVGANRARQHRIAMTSDRIEQGSAREGQEAQVFFGALPVAGIWTPFGLRRGQFLLILALSLLLFVFVDGPAWRHLHDSHFLRIAVSYAVIPLGVAAAFARNHDRRVVLALAASAVIALIKLVLTALLLMLIGIAG